MSPYSNDIVCIHKYFAIKRELLDVHIKHEFIFQFFFGASTFFEEFYILIGIVLQKSSSTTLLELYVMNKMDVLVTRKGQVTIPAKHRKKYGIKEGMRMIVEDSSLGIVFRPIPSLEDLAGVDAGKCDARKMKELLDKGRAEWR